MTDFTGTFKVQASIQSLPQDTDWFDVYTMSPTGIDGLLSVGIPVSYVEYTGTQSYTFEGNYRWVRFIVDEQAGNVDKIILSV
jgi:hypothetical protein